MLRSRPERILTTHVGSLPRPDGLRRLILAREAGDDRAAELRERLPAAVDRIVQQQRDAGIDIVSDGELSKAGCVNYVRRRLEGMDGVASLPHYRDAAEAPAGPPLRMPVCVGPLRYAGHDELRYDIANLLAAREAHHVEEVFMPAASPGLVFHNAPNRHYPSPEAYLVAIADAMREEYEAIAGAGVVLQLDCPDIPAVAHATFWAQALVERLGHRGFVELMIEALNHATARIPAHRMRLHLCWGNYPASHCFDCPLESVLEPVLARARPQAISFAAANPRHEHEWAVFASLALPEDRVIMPGVVDPQSHHVEHPEVVAQRLERFVQLVGPGRVIAGTDCGFATYVGHEAGPPATAWLKLRSLAEGAARTSARTSPAR